MALFAENLKKLPGISHLEALRLLDSDGNLVALIENRHGSQGSLAGFNHLAQTYGAITRDAALKGLELYAEHVADARAHPGKHPNIDILIRVSGCAETLRVKHVFSV